MPTTTPAIPTTAKMTPIQKVALSLQSFWGRAVTFTSASTYCSFWVWRDALSRFFTVVEEPGWNRLWTLPPCFGLSVWERAGKDINVNAHKNIANRFIMMAEMYHRISRHRAQVPHSSRPLA